MDIKAPVAEATLEPVAEPTIAEHEAQYGPAAKLPQPERDDETQPERPRHRASSQKASPDDVAQINALTKELRDKEAELVKLKPDAITGSPRLTVLRRQIKAIEAELEDAKPKPPRPALTVTPLAEPVRREPSPPAVEALSTFSEKELTLDEFIAQNPGLTDAYSAHQRYLAAYDRRKEKHDTKQAELKAQQQEQATAAERADQARMTKAAEAYQASLAAFKKTQPDFDTVLAAVGKEPIPRLAEYALMTHDNGPQLVYTLAQSPALLSELFLYTDGKAVTDLAVANVQRWLTARMQAVSTGSAAPIPRTPAPRPPNPVRTGPMTPGDQVPGDESSLAEHERYYGRKPRR